jgi:hypothetical protein
MRFHRKTEYANERKHLRTLQETRKSYLLSSFRNVQARTFVQTPIEIAA